MPHQRQQPRLSHPSSSTSGNPLRALLDGLKKVSNPPTMDPNSNHPSSSTIPSPRMLTQNNSAAQQRHDNQAQLIIPNSTLHYVVRPDVRPQFPTTNTGRVDIVHQQSNFIHVGQQSPGPPPPRLMSFNNSTANSFENPNRHANNHAEPQSLRSLQQQPPPLSDKLVMREPHPSATIAQQSLPRPEFHSQPLSSFPPISGQMTHPPIPGQMTQSPISGQMTQSSIPGQMTQSPISGQMTQSSISGQMTQSSISGQMTHPPIPGQMTQSSISGQMSQSMPTFLNVFPLPRPPLLLQQQQPQPQRLPVPSSQQPPMLNNPHRPPQPGIFLPRLVLNSPPSQISHQSQLPPFATTHPQLLLASQINHIRKGFQQLVESKSKSDGSANEPSMLHVNSQAGEIHVVSSNGGDNINTRPIPVNTHSVNCEPQPVPEVKTEVIEIDEEDDDCLVTKVDFSKQIFVLNEKHHDTVIDLVDDEEDDRMAVQNEAVVIKPDPDAPVICPNNDNKTVNIAESVVVDLKDDREKEMADVQVIPTSVSVSTNATTGSTPTAAEGRKAPNDKVITSVDTADKAKHDAVTTANQKASGESNANEIQTNDIRVQNAPSSIQHIRSALVNIMHSMKEKEGMSSQKGSGLPSSGVDQQKAETNRSTQKETAILQADEGVRDVENDFSGGENDDDNGDEQGQSLWHVATNVIADLHVNSPPATVQNSKSMSPKVSNKSCSLSSERPAINVASLCKKNFENSSTPKNNIVSSSVSISPGNENRNESDDAIEKDSSVSNASVPVNRGRKRRKPGPKPGSKRCIKRLKNDEVTSVTMETSPAEGSKESQSLDQDLTSTNVAEQDSGKNTKEVVISSQTKGDGGAHTSGLRNQTDHTKESHLIGKNNEKLSTSISKSDKSDNENDDDDDDDDDSGSMSESSYSSGSDSSDDADIQYTCKLCSKSFSKRSHLKKHMKLHYSDKDVKEPKKKVLCKGCRRKFSDATALQAHLLQRRYCFFDCTRVFWKKKERSSKVCQMCGKGQAKWKDLKKHSFRDLTCRLRFINLVLERTKKNDKEHKPSGSTENGIAGDKPEEGRKKSDGKDKVEEDDMEKKKPSASEAVIEGSPDKSEDVGHKFCSSCKQQFQSPFVFSKHLNGAHKCKEFYLNPYNKCPIKLNYCPQCSIFMSSQSKLLNHLCCGKSENSTTVKCNVCFKICSDERGVSIHQTKTSCGKIHKKTLADEINKNIEEGAKGNGSVRNDNGSLEEEQSANSVLKPHSCDVCSKSFNQMPELLDHSHSHTDEGQYKCKDCDMTFGRYNRLVSHMIWHKRKRDLEDRENKGEEDQSSLPHKTVPSSTTKSISNRGSDFKCPQCPLKFKLKSSFSNHLRVHKVKKLKRTADKKFIRNIKKQIESSESDDMKFSCSNCCQRFSTLSGRNDHLIICRSQSQAGNNNKDDNTVSSTSSAAMGKAKILFHQCLVCPAIIKRCSFGNHLKFHVDGISSGIRNNATKPLETPIKVVCIICNKVYGSKKILLRHLWQHNANDIMGPALPSYQPPSKRFRSRPRDQNPDDSGLANEGLSNSLQGKSSPKSPVSPSQKGLKQKIAQKTYKLSCKICNKMFSNIPTFKFHLKIAHKHVENTGLSDYANYLDGTGCNGDSDSKKEPDREPHCTRPVVSNSPPETGPGRMFVNCEICQKMVQRRSRPRHMQDVHGLPRAMFLVRPRKSPGMNIKNEIGNTGSSSGSNNTKDLSFPRIEVDMGGANITSSGIYTVSPPTSSMDAATLIECSVCEKSFPRRGLLWKHLFSHITPCSVTGMKLEHVIKEVPKGTALQDVNGSGLGHENVVTREEVDMDVGNDDDDDDDNDNEVPPAGIDISVADEAAVSFDIGGSGSVLEDHVVDNDVDVKTTSGELVTVVWRNGQENVSSTTATTTTTPALASAGGGSAATQSGTANTSNVTTVARPYHLDLTESSRPNKEVAFSSVITRQGSAYQVEFNYC